MYFWNQNTIFISMEPEKKQQKFSKEYETVLGGFQGIC